MAWRDRLRRRATGADGSGAGPGGLSGAGDSSGSVTAGSPGDGGREASGAAGSAARGSSVPGDWDGGWRRTAPPTLTVARAPLGVSDGLAFRSGLAAWQNPSFDNGLGHALMPTAPAGLVRGVTRPAAPQPTRTGGGPLLLRAMRPEGADGPQDGASDAGNPGSAGRPSSAAATPVARRTRPGARPSGSAASGPGSSGSSGAGSAASQTSGSGSAASGSPGSGSGSSGPTPTGSASSGSAGAGSGSGPVIARSGDDSTAGARRSADARRTRGITSADSPAVLSSSPPAVQRAVEPGAAPVVTPSDTGRAAAAREIPLVRRVAVIPGTPADGSVNRPAPAARPSAPRPDSGSASRSPGGSGGRTTSGPAVQRTATSGTTGSQSVRGSRQPEASRASGVDVSPVPVPLRPVGHRLNVARRQAGPARRVPALRPAPAAQAPVATSDAPGPATTTPAGTTPSSTPPVQRAATRTGSRAPLGAPMTELPSTATPLADGTPAQRPAPGPALPVVQRQTDGTSTSDGGVQGTAQEGPAPRRTSDSGRSGARARGGLGAPLPALPASADVPGAAASGARASRPSPGPAVQRAPARRDDQRSAADSAPPAMDRDGTPTGSAPPARGEGGADAPLLGAVDVQRSVADHSATHGTTTPGPTDHGNGPATPLVTPSPAAAPHGPAPEGAVGPTGTASRPAATSGGPGPGGHRSHDPAGPGPVVVARAPAETETGAPATTGGIRPTTETTAGVRPTAKGTGGAAVPRPLTVTRSAPPAAPRTLQLLPARPLTLNTRAPEGVSQPAASRTGGRPVVAARWPGAAAAPDGDPAASARPTPGPSSGAAATPPVQQAATAHGPRNSGAGRTGSPGVVQRVPVVKPAPPHGTSATAAAAPATAVPGRSLPVTAPQSPPLADRPSATSAPAPVGPVPVVRPRTVAPGGGTGGAATPVQREASRADDAVLKRDTAKRDAVPKGVPVKSVPAGSQSRTDSKAAKPAAPGKRAETPQDPGLDLDDLARRLLDPMARLLRTELRRGRERTGRPYDGRR